MTPRRGDLVVTGHGARFQGRAFPCAVGRAGIGEKSREGDGITPAGVFRITDVLYRPDRIRIAGACSAGRFRPWRAGPGPAPANVCTGGRTTICRAIGPHAVWSDDPRDPDYNREVMGPRAMGHAYGHERLRRADSLYDLIAVLDFNRPSPRPGLGSAVFLHAWRNPRHPTEGCVAFAQHDLVSILCNWRARSRVVIQPVPIRDMGGRSPLS